MGSRIRYGFGCASETGWFAGLVDTVQEAIIASISAIVCVLQKELEVCAGRIWHPLENRCTRPESSWADGGRRKRTNRA
jgi:hypothetical protein